VSTGFAWLSVKHQVCYIILLDSKLIIVYLAMRQFVMVLKLII